MGNVHFLKPTVEAIEEHGAIVRAVRFEDGYKHCPVDISSVKRAGGRKTTCGTEVVYKPSHLIYPVREDIAVVVEHRCDEDLFWTGVR